MLKLYIDILDKKRILVWKDLVKLGDVGVLGGGTALALQFKHRKSFDFDIFSDKPISSKLIWKMAEVWGKEKLDTLVDSKDELTVLVGKEVKVSALYFPFKNIGDNLTTESIEIMSLSDLLANKAYAIGRRGMWRDYVDIFWSVKNKKADLGQIISWAKEKFSGLFSEKLFLEQLVYFDDLKERTVDWIGDGYENEEIERYLKLETSNLIKWYARSLVR